MNRLTRLPALLLKIAPGAALFCASGAVAEVTSFPVIPSATDPAIKTFDEAHWVYVDHDIVAGNKTTPTPDRRELLLWLPGTGGTARGAQDFVTLAAGLGYHVISLMYPDDIPASACSRDDNPKSFEDFRLAIIQGGRATYRNGLREISIDRHDSIESRLIRLLRHLQEIRPKENWAQFLNKDGTIRWEAVAVAGQSQGGGHAMLIGINHRVARVIGFGSPKDYGKKSDAPAAWYAKESATPKSRFFAFNHRQDPVACTPEQLLKNLAALKLDTFGRPADVDSEPAPYRHARILFTGHPAPTITDATSPEAKIAHGSAISTRNADRRKPVWTYLLTEKTDLPEPPAGPPKN